MKAVCDTVQWKAAARHLHAEHEGGHEQEPHNPCCRSRRRTGRKAEQLLCFGPAREGKVETQQGGKQCQQPEAAWSVCEREQQPQHSCVPETEFVMTRHSTCQKACLPPQPQELWVDALGQINPWWKFRKSQESKRHKKMQPFIIIIAWEPIFVHQEVISNQNNVEAEDDFSI